jgi:ADP-ribosylglycohydrolase
VLVFPLIPIFLAIAILRYRLWDIDTLINRTLVYGSLTLSLAAVYAGAVVVLEAVTRAITGQRSEFAIAVATLAVAALFNPWRRRLQAFIDRRFYRRRYDATRTLAVMSSRLRDDVDIDTLVNDIIGVVDQTLQPSHVSLWLHEEAVR